MEACGSISSRLQDARASTEVLLRRRPGCVRRPPQRAALNLATAFTKTFGLTPEQEAVLNARRTRCRGAAAGGAGVCRRGAREGTVAPRRSAPGARAAGDRDDAAHEERAYASIYRWVQSHCAQLQVENAESVARLRRGVASLRQRPTLLSYCVREVATCRRAALHQQLVRVLSTAGNGRSDAEAGLHWLNDCMKELRRQVSLEQQLLETLFVSETGGATGGGAAAGEIEPAGPTHQRRLRAGGRPARAAAASAAQLDARAAGRMQGRPLPAAAHARARHHLFGQCCAARRATCRGGRGGHTRIDGCASRCCSRGGGGRWRRGAGATGRQRRARVSVGAARVHAARAQPVRVGLPPRTAPQDAAAAARRPLAAARAARPLALLEELMETRGAEAEAHGGSDAAREQLLEVGARALRRLPPLLQTCSEAQLHLQSSTPAPASAGCWVAAVAAAAAAARRRWAGCRWASGRSSCSTASTPSRGALDARGRGGGGAGGRLDAHAEQMLTALAQTTALDFSSGAGCRPSWRRWDRRRPAAARAQLGSGPEPIAMASAMRGFYTLLFKTAGALIQRAERVASLPLRRRALQLTAQTVAATRHIHDVVSRDSSGVLGPVEDPAAHP